MYSPKGRVGDRGEAIGDVGAVGAVGVVGAVGAVGTQHAFMYVCQTCKSGLSSTAKCDQLHKNGSYKLGHT
jgi:hypothetical protein